MKWAWTSAFLFGPTFLLGGSVFWLVKSFFFFFSLTYLLFKFLHLRTLRFLWFGTSMEPGWLSPVSVLLLGSKLALRFFSKPSGRRLVFIFSRWLISVLWEFLTVSCAANNLEILLVLMNISMEIEIKYLWVICCHLKNGLESLDFFLHFKTWTMYVRDKWTLRDR
jgi:hypothetical protein